MNRLAVSAAAAVLGLALVGLAAPRVLSALDALPAGTVLARLARGAELPPARLANAAASLERALRRRADADAAAALGLVRLRQAEGAPTAQQAERLEQSRAATVAGLRARPGSPYAWTRLAQAELLLQGPGEATMAAYRMALASGPHLRDLMPARLDVGLALWPRLPEPLRQATAAQIRAMAEADDWRFIALAEQRRGLAAVRMALAPVPDLLASYRRKAGLSDG